jgi:hypothetical protein
MIRIPWNPKVRYRLQKTLPLVSMLKLVKSIHTAPMLYLKIHLNVIPSALAFDINC